MHDQAEDAFGGDDWMTAPVHLVLAGCWVLIDLPLSAVADTLTLPGVLSAPGRPPNPDPPAEPTGGGR